MKLPLSKTAKIFLSAVAAFFAVSVTSCGGEDTPEPVPPVPPVSPEPEETATPRTVLVYMLANNSLGNGTPANPGFDALDLQEMEIAAANGDLGDSRLLVYHHAKGSSTPVMKEITPDGIDTLKVYDAVPYASVTISRMKEVFNDARTLSPSESYGLVLWSHASGWLQDGISDDQMPLKSFGEDNGRKMNVTSLAAALDGEGFDYVYFDCCYMATVETVYQLRNVTDRIVASSAELPARGMPYDKTLKYLSRKDADLIGAATVFYEEYQAEYDRVIADTSLSEWRKVYGCTISVIDTEGLDALADATQAVYAAHPELPSSSSPQQFQTGTCYYYDFRDYVGSLTGVDPSLAANWVEALERTVVYQAATPAIKMVYTYPVNAHCGLTTYILRSTGDAYKNNYNTLDWYADVAYSLF